jgi:hypothetical protein
VSRGKANESESVAVSKRSIGVASVMGCAAVALAVTCQVVAGDDAVEQPSSPVARWHLLEPLWGSPVVQGESVLFVRETPESAPNARLLLPVAAMVRVARADGAMVFEEGKDYSVDASGVLTLPAGSRIPFLQAAELFPASGSPKSLPHRVGDTKQAVLFDNEHWFHDQQIEVTYRPAEAWRGYRPTPAHAALPKTMAKLRAKEPLRLAVSGDSISYGLNASGLTGAEPRQPIYPQLVAKQLEATFGSRVELSNRAVGGWRVEHGLTDLPNLLATKPDLVLVAYGMNHVGGRDPEGFGKLLAQLVQGIRQSETAPEIILVAPMIGNGQWVHTPREQFEPHRDAIARLTGDGIALADLTALWSDLLARKRDADLTGNGVNHPNDFGHRLYAQAVLGLLIEMPQSAGN